LELLRKGLSYVLESRVFFNELLLFFQWIWLESSSNKTISTKSDSTTWRSR
jgi:hypothetical protein